MNDENKPVAFQVTEPVIAECKRSVHRLIEEAGKAQARLERAKRGVTQRQGEFDVAFDAVTKMIDFLAQAGSIQEYQHELQETLANPVEEEDDGG